MCKGYGHLVGPTKMYCISTEKTTSKEKAKAPKKLNFLQPVKLDETDWAVKFALVFSIL